MKLFRVVVERDGKTIKEAGVVETEVKRIEYRYAAANMLEVWQTIAFLRDDPECSVIGIVEDAPHVQVLGAGEPAVPSEEPGRAAA